MFSYMLFNAQVTQWINQPTLNAIWHPEEDLEGFICHTYILYINPFALPFFHDDICFSHNYILKRYKNMQEFLLVYAGKVAECPYSAQLNTTAQPRPPSRGTVSSGKASQI